jgi:hypothetical protein
MAVRIECSCGGKYDLRDEFAGRVVSCPKCGSENTAPLLPGEAAVTAGTVFDRDVFLLRQQALKIAGSTGATTRIGADFQTVAVAWQRSWFR